MISVYLLLDYILTCQDLRHRQKIVALLRHALVLGCLVNQIHELVELWCDDDLRTAVALFAHFRVVACQRIVLTTAAGSHSFRIYTIVALQELHHARCAKG